MNDDELKKLWQQQPLREPPSAAQLVSAMQKQTSQLRRSWTRAISANLWPVLL